MNSHQLASGTGHTTHITIDDVSKMISIVGPEVLPQSIGVDFSYYEFADGSIIVYTEDPDGMEAVFNEQDITQAVEKLRQR